MRSVQGQGLRNTSEIVIRQEVVTYLGMVRNQVHFGEKSAVDANFLGSREVTS